MSMQESRVCWRSHESNGLITVMPISKPYRNHHLVVSIAFSAKRYLQSFACFLASCLKCEFHNTRHYTMSSTMHDIIGTAGASGASGSGTSSAGANGAFGSGTGSAGATGDSGSGTGSAGANGASGLQDPYSLTN